jgi:hypothetical protein
MMMTVQFFFEIVNFFRALFTGYSAFLYRKSQRFATAQKRVIMQ